jgi:hypothetical protein
MFTFDVAPPIVAPLFTATASNFSAPSPTASSGPTASDLAFEDPNLVNGATLGIQGIESGINPSVGTTV